MSAARAFRQAIAQQRERHAANTEIRVDPHRSVCDFCTSPTPTWFYDCEELALTTGGKAILLADAKPEERGLHRFDRGWLACDQCMPLIEAEDGEALIRRWRRPQHASLRHVSFERLERAEREIMGVHALFLRHKRGPEEIRPR